MIWCLYQFLHICMILTPALLMPGRGSYYLKVIYMYGAKSPFSRDFPLSNGREIREFPLTKGLESEKLP